MQAEQIAYIKNRKMVIELIERGQDTWKTRRDTPKVLRKYGLENVNGIQEIAGVTIYPKEYFNPMNNNTGKLDVTENTHSIHWYSMSWMDSKTRIRSKITRLFHRIFGEDCFAWLKK